MDNNGCGFSSRDIDIDDDFGSRSSISSLLSSVGGGGAEPPHPAAFFDSITGYLDTMNQRVSTPQLMTTNGEAVAGYGATSEQSAEQWQQSTNKGGGTAAAAKVGKKRSRASRRAPTTVLTTDTSNFRAMVQEFTGIPPAPFASASPFSRTRLDFFSPRNLPGGGAASASNPFLLRPFPQRMPAQNGGGGASNFAPPPLFSSLLHPNLLNKTTTTSLTEAQVKAGLLEELGLNPPLLPDLVPSERRSAQWPDGAAACKMSYNKSATGVGGGSGGDVGRIRTLDLEDAAVDPHHHVTATIRPDRIVDSWISSSDQTLDKLVQ